MRGNSRDDLRLEELEGDLEAGLGALISGLEFVDRDLELDAELRVDYIGLDTRGRLLLVLLVNEDDDATPLMALDVLAYARENLHLLSRHLTKGSLRADLDPLVALVAERFSTRLAARMLPLRESIRLFEVRELRSSGGSASYLVPVGGPELAEPESASDGPVDFVALLPKDQRDLGYLLVRRISRIDTELECQASPDGLTWHYEGDEICSIRQVPTGIEGRVAGDGPRVAIRSARDVEVFIEEALGYQVERSEEPIDGDLPDEDSLDEVPVPRSDGPILSAEEIQAFQQ
ncbi:MAG: hypothetical protein ACI841_001317 [Planctomycetota bacterium]|jgi:hypothetical protein